MSEAQRPAYSERVRRAKVMIWTTLLPPCGVAGLLIAMVGLSGKPPWLLWIALALIFISFAASMIIVRFYVQGGAKGRAPDGPWGKGG
jgi:uncharacterized membrane protein